VTILLAAPTCREKDYALDRWNASRRAFFGYGDLPICLVDTTRDDAPPTYANFLIDYLSRQNADYSVRHVDPDWHVICTVSSVSQAWECIISEAHYRNVDYILSIEIDVWCPPDTVQTLLGVAEATDAGVVTHTYPYPSMEHGLHSLGCALIDPKMFDKDEKFFGNNCKNFEDLMWDRPNELGRGIVSISNCLRIEHDNKMSLEHFDKSGEV